MMRVLALKSTETCLRRQAELPALVQAAEELVLRGFHYCVIDEVDSILIDEARTPLIISGAAGNAVWPLV